MTTNATPLSRSAQLIRTVAVMAAVLLLSACATHVINRPITDQAPGSDYSFKSRLPDNDKNLFVVLAFSGGGTRAASLSYGVLEALRDQAVHVQNHQSRLLDQVDVITAVSGGAYTAAYYGLFGEQLFDEFPEKFLYQNWQSIYGWMLANPFNLARISSGDFNRTDLMAAYLNRTIFEGRTFNDLSLGSLPFVIINATDLNNSLTFPFIQSQFDFLCSDLGTYPVANAVMASSTVPPAFAPIALRNYSGCPQQKSAWVADALKARHLLSREYAVARALSRYHSDARMPWLRLVDGGVTDNLGVRGSMMSPVAHHGDVASMAGAFSPSALDAVDDVLVILVNAQVYPPYPWSVSGNEPGLSGTLTASFDAAFNTLSNEAIAQAKREFLKWGEMLNKKRGPDRQPVDVRFVTLTFNQIADTKKRAWFNHLATANLKKTEVTALINLAHQLLGQSADYQAFLNEFGR